MVKHPHRSPKKRYPDATGGENRDFPLSFFYRFRITMPTPIGAPKRAETAVRFLVRIVVKSVLLTVR
jgi:hypothetical protein